jgi:hypothetical protein
MDMNNIAPMHKYLTGFEKYSSDLPIYIEDALSPEAVESILKAFEDVTNGVDLKVDDLSSPKHPERYAPRIMAELSRLVVEFPFPEIAEKEMDAVILPLYQEPLKLSHFSYLDYAPKYSDYKVAPSLPPHIDAAETILTFNYQIGGNIDWEIYIDGEPHSLKTGDALIFSSLNQVHWRPKRVWGRDDFVKILTVNYSPLDNWRFTGQVDPLDVRYHKEQRQKYVDELNSHPRFLSAWSLYNGMGEEAGIPSNVHGIVEEA